MFSLSAKKTIRRVLLVITSSIVVLLAIGKIDADELVDFSQDIRPILADNCFKCHGPDDEQRESDLRLDRFDDAKTVISAGETGQSELIRRVISFPKMPSGFPLIVRFILTMAVFPSRS